MRAAVCFLVLLIAVPAQAIPYETFIDVDDEGDLQDLLAAGTITDDTYDELLDLLASGVDLNDADRQELYTLPNLTYDDVDAIIAYRDLQKGRIRDPAELVTAGALSEEKLLAISAFLIVTEPGALEVHGFVRAWTRASPHDFTPNAPQSALIPPVLLRGRFTALRHLTAGFALTNTRLRIGEPVYDPNRGSLIADPRSNQLHMPKAYVKWEDHGFTAIAGTYRAGFGQRLVFDNTHRYTPNGLYADDQMYYSADLDTACKESTGELIVSPCTGANGSEYVTPDFVWRDGLLGIGAGIKEIELASGWLQLYGFGSISNRSIYQYELVDRAKCEDPHDDDDPACSAPVVYVKPDGDLLTPTTRFAFETLPNVFQERLAGGNISYFADRRSSVGITGYGATETNLVKGIDLDVQEWSRLPTGKRFGAIGANFAYGFDHFDFFGEGAWSFDGMPKQDPALTPAHGGGGPAGLVRMTYTKKKEELELVGRYFSTDYLNPYARPISEADEFEGQRARDEAGLRTRYVRVTKDLQLRALLDVWVNPSAPQGKFLGIQMTPPKLDTYVRASVRTTPALWLGLWERYQDKNLERGGHDQCFEVSTDTDENGEPVPCAGRQLTTILRGQFVPGNMFQATLMLEHQLLDDNTQMDLKTKFRQDIAAWLIAYYRPAPGWRIRGRARYLDEAINDRTYLERSLAIRADGSMQLRDKDTLRLRIDTKFWLDRRASTLERVPNPEVVFWLFYEAKL